MANAIISVIILVLYIGIPYVFSLVPFFNKRLSSRSISLRKVATKLDFIPDNYQNLPDHKDKPQIYIDYSIRKATFNEIPTIAKLRVQGFYPQYATATQFISRIIDKIMQRVDHGAVCLVAQIKNQTTNYSYSSQYRQFGRLIGSIEFSPDDFKNTSMEHIGSEKKLYIADLVVRDDVRRMGVASQLISYIEKHALTNQFKEIYLHVDTTNIIGRQMYEKLGFVEVPPSDVTNAFTEFRLQKSASLFVLLWKEIIS